jgi:hypothetical protein
MIRREDWLRACRKARTGGGISPTLPNLRSAYTDVLQRPGGPADWPADPFSE